MTLRPAAARRLSKFDEHVMFLRRFLRNPRQVGALAPSSQVLAREMVRDIPRHAGVRIVELGPGTGVFTRAVIERLPEGAKFLAVDIDPTFCAELRSRWPSLDCECGSASNLKAMLAARGETAVDYIISGLPFASLPTALSASVLSAIEHTLAPGGSFTTFQYVHAYPMKRAVAFRREMKRRFGAPSTRRVVLENIPPVFVLTWKQRAH
jgi:phosphatidylethanolamine/phosphatidyl-N-methylethanolamine N-methyltransferase